MPTGEDRRKAIGDLTNASRNKRQASVLLTEIARHECVKAAASVSLGGDIVEKSKEIIAKSNRLRARKTA